MSSSSSSSSSTSLEEARPTQMSKNSITSCRESKFIEGKTNGKAMTYPFKMEIIDILEDGEFLLGGLPDDLEEDTNYIITNWCTNSIVKYMGPRLIKVIEHYGSDFKLGEAYVLIGTTY